MSQACHMGLRSACLSGGECLTYPGFDELYLFLYSMGIATSIKTNGVLLDSKRLDFFDRYPPHEVTISLYGSSEDAYVKVTGHRVFSKVTQAVTYLRDKKYNVSLSITPNEFMSEDIEPLLKYANSLGIQYSINYGLFSPRENTGRLTHDMSIEDYVKMILLYEKLKGHIPESSDIIDIPDSNQQKG